MNEQLKINELEVKYELIDGKLTFTTLDGTTHNLGMVLNKESILDEQMNLWYDKMITTITLDKIINYIKQIDNQILNSYSNPNTDDTYNIQYGIFNELFDNLWYSRKFSKSQLRPFENKCEFIKYCFRLYGLDLTKILELKFPNAIIEWKQNNIVVSIF